MSLDDLEVGEFCEICGQKADALFECCQCGLLVCEDCVAWTNDEGEHFCIYCWSYAEDEKEEVKAE